MLLQTINLAEDICPVSEFRSDINSMLQKTKSTHRPIVLTQHGKTTAVVIDIEDYQRLLDQAELFEDLKIARNEIKTGKKYTTTQAKKRLMNRFKNV